MRLPAFRMPAKPADGEPRFTEPVLPHSPGVQPPPAPPTDERLERWQVYTEMMLIGFMSNPAMTMNVAAVVESIAQAADQMVEQEGLRRESYER